MAFKVDDGWGNPTKEAAGQSAVWLHVPARGSIVVVVLSDRPCRYRGHWVEGHMRPCIPTGCEMCRIKLGYQIRYVFAVHDLTTRATGLLELGASAAEIIKEAADRLGFLRGQVFKLSKQAGRERGKILVEEHHQMLETSGLPAAIDAAMELRRMWELEV